MSNILFILENSLGHVDFDLLLNFIENMELNDDINCINTNYKNILHYLLKIPFNNKLFKFLQIILSRGIDVNLQSNFLYTPLTVALLFNQPYKVIKLLLEYGANPNIIGLEKYNALESYLFHRVVNRPHIIDPDIVALLISYGTKITGKFESGNSILHFAARHDLNPKVIKLLMDNGLDPMKPNKNGNTPYDLANDENKKVMRQFLDENVKSLIGVRHVPDLVHDRIQQMIGSKEFGKYKKNMKRK
jgi:ankyrin repeat protein